MGKFVKKETIELPFLFLSFFFPTIKATSFEIVSIKYAKIDLETGTATDSSNSNV